MLCNPAGVTAGRHQSNIKNSVTARRQIADGTPCILHLTSHSFFCYNFQLCKWTCIGSFVLFGFSNYRTKLFLRYPFYIRQEHKVMQLSVNWKLWKTNFRGEYISHILFPVVMPFLCMCRTIFLPVVLYGCETWSLTLRDERKLRVFENMVLRRIFGPRRDDVTGEWRR